MTLSNSLVSVHIVTWNGISHLPSCLQSVTHQTYTAISTMVVDNGSVDGTVSWLASEYPQVHLLRNNRNLGFCRGHNQAIRITDSPYILCLNQDVVLTESWIAQAVSALEQHPECGAISGKLLRYSYSNEELKSVLPSVIIDSAGLQMHRSRHVIDRGSGEQDLGQFNNAGIVFGLSGACVLYRRSALEAIRYKDEYFDEDFFAYKDDIDVARRLQRMNLPCWYDGSIVAYHFRSIRGQSSTNIFKMARNYKPRQIFNARYSYRNHWLMLMKHETLTSVLPDLPWILWYEFRKAGYLLATRPSTLLGGIAALRQRGSMNKKAKELNLKSKQPASNIRVWWTQTS